MYRLLNKSPIWLLCQCVNHCLWNLSKLPFTGAVLQSTSLSNPTARPPAMGGRVCGWLVGWSVSGLKFPKLFRCADSFTWATRIPCSGQRYLRHLWAYLVRSFGRVIELLCKLLIVHIWQPGAYGILFLKNHKNRNQPWTAVFIKKPPETYCKSENGNRHSATLHSSTK